MQRRESTLVVLSIFTHISLLSSHSEPWGGGDYPPSTVDWLKLGGPSNVPTVKMLLEVLEVCRPRLPLAFLRACYVMWDKPINAFAPYSQALCNKISGNITSTGHPADKEGSQDSQAVCPHLILVLLCLRLAVFSEFIVYRVQDWAPLRAQIWKIKGSDPYEVEGLAGTSGLWLCPFIEPDPDDLEVCFGKVWGLESKF